MWVRGVCLTLLLVVRVVFVLRWRAQSRAFCFEKVGEDELTTEAALLGDRRQTRYKGLISAHSSSFLSCARVACHFGGGAKGRERARGAASSAAAAAGERMWDRGGRVMPVSDNAKQCVHW